MFSIELGHRKNDDVFGWPTERFDEEKPVVDIELPATEYELLDAIDRAGLKDGAEAYMCYVVSDFSYLAPRLEKFDDLIILNAAAEKLCDMDEQQLTAVTALVQKDTDDWKSGISAARLYDLVCAADQCEVLTDVFDAYTLGCYYADNGLVPELESASDALKRMIDYQGLGYQIHDKEKGIFVTDKVGYKIPYKGYVQLQGEISEHSAELNLGIEPPAYTIRAYARCFELQTEVTLDLPMEQEELQQALASLGAPKPEMLEYYCVDSKVIALNEVVRYSIYGHHDRDCADFEGLNELARRIKELPDADLEVYKAALTLRKPTDTDGALAVLDEVGEYTLLPNICSAAEYGESVINSLLDECDAQYVLAHLDLNGYGKDLLEFREIRLTEYGAIERNDGLSIHSVEEQKRGGGFSVDYLQMQ